VLSVERRSCRRRSCQGRRTLPERSCAAPGADAEPWREPVHGRLDLAPFPRRQLLTATTNLERERHRSTICFPCFLYLVAAFSSSSYSRPGGQKTRRTSTTLEL